MKVIETNKFGKPTGWQQGKNKMFLEKYDGGHFYLVEKPFKKNKFGTEEETVVITEKKFKDAKKRLLEVV